MYFLEDPDKRKGLWSSFEESLLIIVPCYLVKEGVGDLSAKSRKIENSEEKFVIKRFKDSDIKRIGLNHGMAMPPHYAFSLEKDNKTVNLTEYISEPADENERNYLEIINREIENISVTLFYDYPDLDEINVPLYIETSNDFKIHRINVNYCRVVRSISNTYLN